MFFFDSIIFTFLPSNWVIFKKVDPQGLIFGTFLGFFLTWLMAFVGEESERSFLKGFKMDGSWLAFWLVNLHWS